ncbi:MAG: cyclase family protein [Lewinellaceae bacterium]|nr:cyclase family protein [Saprospiraceae bacterium]MCB9329728.1 cyclase family protein [Lewinellaceae bacterium]
MQKTLLFLVFLIVAAGCERSGLQPKAFQFPDGQWIDLTHPFDENTVYWPTAEGFRLDTVFAGITDSGFYYTAFQYCAAEHGGTHLDAPMHFAEGKRSMAEIPVDQLIGAGILIDVAENAAGNPDYRVTVDDFLAWEKENGQLPDGAIVLINTGFGKFWPDRKQYMGTDERGPEAVAKLHFPGLHPDAAQWLVSKRRIHAIGLDTPSIDYGQSTHFESHQILFQQNIPAFENLAQLDQLPAKGFGVVALPMKIKGGSGGPLRIVALKP